MRDRALFDLAIDSKLSGCDLVKIKIKIKIKIGTLVTGGISEHEQWLFSRKLDALYSRLWRKSEEACSPGFSEESAL